MSTYVCGFASGGSAQKLKDAAVTAGYLWFITSIILLVVWPNGYATFGLTASLLGMLSAALGDKYYRKKLHAANRAGVLNASYLLDGIVTARCDLLVSATIVAGYVLQLNEPVTLVLGVATGLYVWYRSRVLVRCTRSAAVALGVVATVLVAIAIWVISNLATVRAMVAPMFQ